MRIAGLEICLPPLRAVAGRQRPIAAEPGGPSDLVLPAARAVLERAGVAPERLGAIIFATATPDVTFPGAGCYLQAKLEAGTVGALDIRAQCSGFFYGLMSARALFAAGTTAPILLATAEVHSAGLDYSERGIDLAALFGDGAAAVLLEPGAGVSGLTCSADGRRYDRFWCEYPASRQHPVRITLEDFRSGRHYPQMDRDAVRAYGREELPAIARKAIDLAGVRMTGLDAVVLAHVLPEVVEEAAAVLGVPGDIVVRPSPQHGHLGSASVPVALAEARREGRIGSGALVCAATCGAGFTSGAAVFRVP